MIDDYYNTLYPTEYYLEVPKLPVNSCEAEVELNKMSISFEEWSVIDKTTGRRRAPRQYEFLLLLLRNPDYASYISWIDESQGLFKIHQPSQVATLWARVKSRQTAGFMDYETFTRGIRFHYKSGKMIKTHRKHTFCFKIPFDNWV